MEASVRILLNSSTTRHFSHALLPFKKPLFPKSLQPSFPPPPHQRPISTPTGSFITPQIHHPATPFTFSNSLTSPHNFLLNSLLSTPTFFHIFSDPKSKSFQWNHAQNGLNKPEKGILDDKAPIFTAVLLGWLGSKPKHLRRYVELYNSKGIHAVTFVASVKDVLSFDLGKKLEERINGLAGELASWLSESENDGRQRFLIFHTFSNTGWLAYGAILDNLMNRPELLEKIKGCVVDSGGDPNIDPKVWAAGFSAALLKKYSSSAYPSFEAGGTNEFENGADTSKWIDKQPLFIETLLLSAFEQLFSYILNLPYVNQRLTKIISVLSKDQPSCPQLYLYSTADNVIPFQSVESFVEDQRRIGRNVRSFNFGSSPHVDHYRTFPSVYKSELERFLNERLVTVIKNCR